MDARKILISWLKENGYDGLQHENDCGCQLSDLIPCGEDCSDCTPGYKRPGGEDEECDFYICAEKPA